MVKGACSIELELIFPGTSLKNKAFVMLLLSVFFTFITCRGDETVQTTTAAAAAANPAGLWQKALEIAKKNSDWYPAKISILSEVLDRHDQPYSVTELFFSISLDAAGKMLTHLDRAAKNGKDISEEMRKNLDIHNPNDEPAGGGKNSLTISLSDSPFNNERQKFVSYQDSGERQMLFGHTCSRYDFSYQTEIIRKGKREKLTWTGMAWLEEQSGAPVKLEFSITPLPKRIRSLWTIYLFDLSHSGVWVLKEIRISGQGGFLFIKKSFRSHTRFSQYQLQPKGEDQN
jgi:hypothetical protein